jgi:two-component system OmpR family sensor kinase
MRRRWVVAGLPTILGLAVASLAVDVVTLPNPIIRVRVDLGTLAVVVGLLLSLLIVAGLGLWGLTERRCERRTADVRVRAAEERRRFLRRLDHELKNPLTAIRAGLANVVDGVPPISQHEALASIAAQVHRLNRLTADLRKLSELETCTLECAPIDTTGLLREAVQVAQEQPEAAARQVTLTLPQVPWPVPAVPGDRDMLFLATCNLLGNALKFTHPGDIVEARAFEDGDAVVIEVADTGPGIPQDEVPLVWEELYRGQGAQGLPGSGLGLALVRAIVERHGGQTALRSRRGQGTVVSMRLPVQ